MNDFVCIYRTSDVLEANLIKSHLENAEIFCVVNTNDASGTLPHLQFALGGAEILVHEDDVEASLKILDNLDDLTEQQ